MQVTETNSEGLKRELKVVVPAEELESRLSSRLEELKSRVTIKGFRPGHVPVTHLRRIYGRSAMAEIVQEILSETTTKTLEDRGEKPAMRPKVDLPEDESETEQILEGKADLAYSVSYEILPDFDLADFKGLKIERPVVTVADEEVESEVARLAESARSYSPKEGAAADGDRVTIAYVGKVDGEPFEGGTDDNAALVLGSGRFIPGFEEQLAGVSAGDERTVSVTFPEDYPAAHLAGKAAEFEVTVNEVAAPDEQPLDDTLAQKFGMESLDALKTAIRDQLQSRYGQQTRQLVKRQLLDQLDESHNFELPASMVDQEFDVVWRQVEGQLAESGRTFEDEDTTEEQARDEYRKIAERRVRLGLVLSEIGNRNQIEVTEDEVQRALQAQIRQFPGQEEQVVNYYRQNPDAVAGLRAPIFEEKVADYLMELAEVTDKPVSPEELAALTEDEHAGHDHAGHDHSDHDHSGHDHD